MTRLELIEKGFEDVVVFENPAYDGCMIGVSTDRRAIYSLAQMAVWYYAQNNSSAEEALEFIEYNPCLALYENAPIILDDL